MDAAQWELVLTAAIPVIGVFLLLLLGKRPDAREAVSVIAAILTFFLTVLLLPSAFDPVPVSTPAVTIYPGFTFQFCADALGVLFACLASFLWIITSIYNIGYMRGLSEHSQTRYYACFALVTGAVMGVAFSTNLFSLFVFYEILTVATYPLVVHSETGEALSAGLKYLAYNWSGGGAILAGMLILLQTVGTLAFVSGGNSGIAGVGSGFLRLAFFLLFAGFGVKAAIVPLHGWLPSAMVAPTPVSGLLHAVAVVNAGVFGLFRVMLYLYGPDLITGLGLRQAVIAVAVITIITGSLLALVQDDLKLRLAYSTISQLSYMILGAAVLLPPGFTGASESLLAVAIIGATYAFCAHAFGKLTMFFVAGAVFVETHKTKISELDGLGRKMPWEFAAFTLAALSLVGLPPMAGFISKWYLSLGIGAGYKGEWWMLLILAASSVLNLAYFLPVIIRAFFRPGKGEIEGVRWTLRGPVVVTAAGALFCGVWTAYPWSPFALCAQIASSVTHTAILVSGPFVAGIALPPFLIFFAGAPFVLIASGRVRRVLLIFLGGLALADVLLLPGGSLSGTVSAGVMQWNLPLMNYTLTLLRVDALSYFVGIIFALITFFAILYAAVAAPPRLQMFALLYAGTALGVVFAGDWITLLIFWEVMAVVSTFLIWQETGAAIGAGYRYLLFHGLGGTLLGAGVALLFLGAGSAVVGPVSGITDNAYQLWALVLIILGMGVNLCFIPLHTWLVDAYPKANFVASVFLSVYTTKAAVYLLARLQPGPEFFAFIGALMAVYGVVFAMFQNDMRRLLSYHLVSQVGYMVAGIGILGWMGAANDIGQLGLYGGMAHLFNNILYKTLLFMAVGVIVWKTGENLLSRVGGLQKKMPVTALVFWVAAFSIAGVPPFNGFVSKGMVLTAAEHTNIWLWVLLETAAFGTLVSFLKLGYFAFLRPGNTAGTDPPLLMQLGMVGIAALCIIIGIFPGILYAILPGVVIFHAYTPEHLFSAIIVLGAAALFFFTTGKKVLEPHETQLKDADIVYMTAARGVIACAEALQEIFRRIYRFVTVWVRDFLDAGRYPVRMLEWDLNWSLATLALGSAIVLSLIHVFSRVR